MLFKMNSLEEEAIWHIDPLPGNCATAAITWQQLCKQAFYEATIAKQQMNGVLCGLS
jgi:hypothetical protein